MPNEPRFSGPGSRRTLPPHAERQGPAPAEETADVTLRLRPKAPLAFEPRRAPMSRPAFEAAHGADPARTIG